MGIQLSSARLRPWRLEDAHALVKHANNRNVSRYLVDRFPYPYTPADAERALPRLVDERAGQNFAIEVDGEAAGSISLRLQDDIHRRSAELGYWLSESHWGLGIMTEAVRAITSYGWQRLDIVRIYGEVFEPNRASQRVLEKAGYVLEGRLRSAITKDGVTMDALLYAVVRGEAPR